MLVAEEKNRITGIDFVRVLAVFFVICVHFFLHNGFYQEAMLGKRMLLMTSMRWLFFTCVPLFLVLTGYLNWKKKFQRKSYWRLGEILISYLFISIVIILFKVFYLKQEISLTEWGFKILNYTAANYAWYIEMYIGLFMLIPFLNLIYHGLETRRQKEFLLLVMLFVTSIFSVTNLYHKILPDYWASFYPITYYFIGAYIAEYQIKVKKKYSALGIILVILLETAVAFHISNGYPFRANSFDAWGSLTNTMATVFLFLFFYDLDLKNKIARWIVIDISKVSFDMYLISFVFDSMIYGYLTPKFPDAYSMLPYFIPCVLFSFIGSYIFSVLKRGLFELVWKKKKVPVISTVSKMS